MIKELNVTVTSFKETEDAYVNVVGYYIQTSVESAVNFISKITSNIFNFGDDEINPFYFYNDVEQKNVVIRCKYSKGVLVKVIAKDKITGSYIIAKLQLSKIKDN